MGQSRTSEGDRYRGRPARYRRIDPAANTYVRTPKTQAAGNTQNRAAAALPARGPTAAAHRPQEQHVDEVTARSTVRNRARFVPNSRTSGGSVHHDAGRRRKWAAEKVKRPCDVVAGPGRWAAADR